MGMGGRLVSCTRFAGPVRCPWRTRLPHPYPRSPTLASSAPGDRVKSAFGVATRALARPLTQPPRRSFGIHRGACPRHRDAPTAERLSRDQSAAGPTFMPGGPEFPACVHGGGDLGQSVRAPRRPEMCWYADSFGTRSMFVNLIGPATRLPLVEHRLSSIPARLAGYASGRVSICFREERAVCLVWFRCAVTDRHGRKGRHAPVPSRVTTGARARAPW